MFFTVTIAAHARATSDEREIPCSMLLGIRVVTYLVRRVNYTSIVIVSRVPDFERLLTPLGKEIRPYKFWCEPSIHCVHGCRSALDPLSNKMCLHTLNMV